MSETTTTPCPTPGCAGILVEGAQYCSTNGHHVGRSQWAKKGLDSPRRKVKAGGAIFAMGLLICWVVWMQMPHETVTSVGGDIATGGGGPDLTGSLFLFLLWVVSAFTAAFGALLFACGAIQGGFRVATGERVGTTVKGAAKGAATEVRTRAPQAQQQFQQQVTQFAPKAKEAGDKGKDVSGRAIKAAGEQTRKFAREVGPKADGAKRRLAPQVSKTKELAKQARERARRGQDQA